VLPVALIVARPASWAPRRHLVGPLLRFGALLVPVMLTGWIMNASNRYILGLFRDLGDVAIFGVGYKFGMVVEMAVVWPFQLAWPAFAFAISHRPDHRATYAHTLTYLTLALTATVVTLGLGTRTLLSVVVGPEYADAYRIVPIVALAYACNGIQYCVAPGIHIAGRTALLTAIAAVAAVVNLILSLSLIPWAGMIGAAWATAGGFAFLALATTVVAQRVHPVRYEYARLAKIVGCGALVYAAGCAMAPAADLMSVVWCALLIAVVFPVLLALTGVPDAHEWAAAARIFRRATPAFGSQS
jgi:O-antigen/teichoic acid export membrane protein